MAENKKAYCEQDVMTELLVSLKHLKALTNTFTQECSNESLYKEIDAIYQQISCEQRNTFEVMKSKGWYVMEPEKGPKLSKTYTKFSNKEAELS